MDTVDLYQEVGGRDVCRQLSEAFYGRVKRDAVLRPLFPGKTLKCAIEAFAAFLAQFLGGPAEDARERWFLSLHESHQRFRIGPRERQAWLNNMAKALDDVIADKTVRDALQDLFEQSSAYILGSDAPGKPPRDSFHSEIRQRWNEQRALDDLVFAIRSGDAERVLELAKGSTLHARFARDRATFAHVLGLIIGCRNRALLEYAERELVTDPALGRVRNRHNRTLLHDACGRGSLRMVELLLHLGADPNDMPPKGRTPLYCAANERLTGGGAIIHALVKAGARVDTPVGARRCTALHMAARRGNTEIAEALLECGADGSVRDSAGDTPLRRAKNCRKEAVALLLAQFTGNAA